MLFSSGKGGNGDKPKAKKGRSILGHMFNPDIGNDIRPVGEAFSMFVFLLAGIFSTNGLFPKNHPALTDRTGKTRLTMGEVLATAWSNVELTREGFPKATLFFAVVGCLLFSGLFVITYLASLFMPQAHAAESMFVPPNGDFDWGVSWIDYIFRGIAFTPDAAHPVVVPNMCSWQGAMGKALAFYSNGILVLAGLLLLYYLVAMVAETAQYGEAMGKRANKLWAPIRLVLAIGLLVPISSSAGSGGCVSGLNTGQYVVIQMAKWGSGLASNIWKQFVDTLVDDPAPGGCVPGSPSCTSPAAEASSLANKMIYNYACAEIYNFYLEQLLDGNMATPEAQQRVVKVVTEDVTAGDHFFGAEIPDDINKICGGYKIPAPGSSDKYKAVYDSQAVAFRRNLRELQDIAKKHAMCYVNGYGDNSVYCDTIVRLDLDAKVATEKLYNDIAHDVDQTVKSVDRENLKIQKENAEKGGWMVAGAWFNEIARMNGERAQSIRQGMPIAVEPALWEIMDNQKRPSFWPDFISGKDSKLSNIGQSTQAAMEAFGKKLNITQKDTAATSTTYIDRTKDNSNLTGKTILDTLYAGGVLPGIYQLIYMAMQGAGLVFTDAGQDFLAIKYDPSKNVWSEMISFGWAVLNFAQFMMTAGGLLYVLSAAQVMGTGAGAGAVAIGGILISVGVAVFIAGATMCFILPLHPFFRFFFGSLTWIIGVAEAVVAMPLLALAHINPEGEGLPGGKAIRGYYLILNIFLRPALMVIGLIVAYLLFCVAVSFLNTLFVVASRNSGSFGSSGIMALPLVIYSIMYCVLVYMCGNLAFKTIGMFPQHALTWLGAGGAGHYEHMDGRPISSLLAGSVGALLVRDGVSGLLKAPADAIKSMKAEKQLKDDKANAAMASQIANANMIKAINDLGSGLGGGGGGGGGGTGNNPTFVPPSQGGAGAGGGGGQGPSSPQMPNQGDQDDYDRYMKDSQEKLAGLEGQSEHAQYMKESRAQLASLDGHADYANYMKDSKNTLGSMANSGQMAGSNPQGPGSVPQGPGSDSSKTIEDWYANRGGRNMVIDDMRKQFTDPSSDKDGGKKK